MSSVHMQSGTLSVPCICTHSHSCHARPLSDLNRFVTFGMQVTVLDHSNSIYTVGQLCNDVNSQLSTERCVLAPGSHLTLEGMQAEEGLPDKPMAPRVSLQCVKDPMLLLDHFIKA